MKQIVINGDNIALLKNYPDNYFNAVVTDPPYGLGKEPNAEEVMKGWIEKGYHEVLGSGFMGKEWDAFIPQPIFWKEVFRVLKHGGHVLSFFGSRTYDWGVMAMRFAGFEVRDCIQWLYGSGFPKSHNISKAIDKNSIENKDAIMIKSNLSFYLKEQRLKLNLSTNQISTNFPSKSGGLTGIYRNWELGNSIPTWEDWLLLKNILKLNDDFDNLIEDRPSDFIESKRKVICQNKHTNSANHFIPTKNHKERVTLDITAPSTEKAKQWEGWGSALKPANEPIVLARKPLEKGLSIADNVLKWGTGGINIDGCRVGFTDNVNMGAKQSTNNLSKVKFFDDDRNDLENPIQTYKDGGRFPANLILTHHPECECKGLKKVKAIKGGNSRAIQKNTYNDFGKNYDNTPNGIGCGYSDENGEETIEDWDCVQDCPIRIMDEQSGISKSPNTYIRKSDGFNGDNTYQKNVGEKSGVESRNFGDSGGSSRFFYVAKASKSERNKGLQGFEEKENMRVNAPRENEEEKNSNKMSNFHPTVKPVKLMQYLVRLITPPNGKVLDPFCGSGTTGIACKLEGFEFVGLEQDAEYCKIAQSRIDNYEEEIEEILYVTNEQGGKTQIIQTSLF